VEKTMRPRVAFYAMHPDTANVTPFQAPFFTYLASWQRAPNIFNWNCRCQRRLSIGVLQLGFTKKTLELDGRLAQIAESRELRSATNKGQAELSDGGTLPSFHLG